MGYTRISGAPNVQRVAYVIHTPRSAGQGIGRAIGVNQVGLTVQIRLQCLGVIVHAVAVHRKARPNWRFNRTRRGAQALAMVERYLLHAKTS